VAYNTPYGFFTSSSNGKLNWTALFKIKLLKISDIGLLAQVSFYLKKKIQGRDPRFILLLFVSNMLNVIGKMLK
jgi:hypothetical protein